MKNHKINKKLKRFNKRLNQLKNNIDNYDEDYLNGIKDLKLEMVTTINNIKDLKSEMVTTINNIKDLKSEMVTTINDIKDLKSEMVTTINNIKDLKSEMLNTINDLKNIKLELSNTNIIDNKQDEFINEEKLIENSDEIIDTPKNNLVIKINEVDVDKSKNNSDNKLVLREDILNELDLNKDDKKRMIIYTCLMMDLNNLKNVEMFDIDLDKINAIKMLMSKTGFEINNWDVGKLLSVNKQKYFSEYIQNVFEYKMKVKLETELQIKQIMFKLLKSISLGKYLIKNDDYCNYNFDKSFIKKYNTFIKKLKNNTHSVINNIRSIVKNV
jgi:hypothetical protein